MECRIDQKDVKTKDNEMKDKEIKDNEMKDINPIDVPGENENSENESHTQKLNIEERFRDFLARWPKIHAFYLKYEEILVYLVVGGINTVVSLGAKFLWNIFVFDAPLNPTVLQHVVLSSVAWIVGVVAGFWLNRKYVFKSHGPAGVEFVKFSLSRVSTYFLDVFIMEILGPVLSLNVYVATIISAVVVTILNYVFSKVFVFSKKKGTKPE